MGWYALGLQQFLDEVNGKDVLTRQQYLLLYSSAREMPQTIGRFVKCKLARAMPKQSPW